jgi:CDP-diacylglycerol--serine O-phosphatidyltransferase
MRRKRFRKKQDRPPRRGVYLLPNLMTTASLFCGFYALISAIEHDYLRAALAILASFFFDGLDGRIARATRTTSQFGVEYDSLADLVAFGVAPSVLALTWGVAHWGRLGWLAAFLFTACGALRLARFNVQIGKVPKGFFRGLPIPAAAGVVATMVLFGLEMGWTTGPPPGVMLGTLYCLSFLMVSAIPYQSFKDLELVRQKPFQALVASVLILVVILIHPQVTLFLMASAYALSGPVALLGRLRKRPVPVQGDVQAEKEGVP